MTTALLAVVVAAFALAPPVALAVGPTAATFGVAVGLLVGWDLALKRWEPGAVLQ